MSRRPKSPRSTAVLLVVLIVASVLPACYTLFQHPRLAQLDYRRPEGNRCQSCHSSEELWSFTHPENLPSRRSPWREYYEHPWWFERRWGMVPRTGADTDTTSTEGH